MSSFTYQTSEGESKVEFELSGGKLTVGGQAYECDGRSVWVAGRRIPFWTYQHGDKVSVWLDGEVFSFTHRDPRQRTNESATAGDSGGLVSAQMPGKILSLAVKVGDTVVKGQNLLVMESMKMELALDAPLDGTVDSVDVSIGQLVAQGERLVKICTTA
jgi:acetyl/propionyl-CoA carboxylase alpha subunit